MSSLDDFNLEDKSPQLSASAWSYWEGKSRWHYNLAVGLAGVFPTLLILSIYANDYNFVEILGGISLLIGIYALFANSIYFLGIFSEYIYKKVFWSREERSLLRYRKIVWWLLTLILACLTFSIASALYILVLRPSVF